MSPASPALASAGAPAAAARVDEHAVRAAAGLTLGLGAYALAAAYFARWYLPIQLVTVVFAVEFLLRVSLGLARSPLGWLATRLAARRSPQWVSTAPKRFAWSLGLAMSLSMVLITQAQIRGALPLTICLLCLALMWLEAVLGFCAGCWLHGQLARRGWLPAAYCEPCAAAGCAAPALPAAADPGAAARAAADRAG